MPERTISLPLPLPRTPDMELESVAFKRFEVLTDELIEAAPKIRVAVEGRRLRTLDEAQLEAAFRYVVLRQPMVVIAEEQGVSRGAIEGRWARYLALTGLSQAEKAVARRPAHFGRIQ